MFLDATASADWWAGTRKIFPATGRLYPKSNSAHDYVDLREMTPWIWMLAESWHVGRNSLCNAARWVDKRYITEEGLSEVYRSFHQ
jgi:hypothetical protein